MNEKPIYGKRYRYVGELRAYQGLIGIAASHPDPVGKIWQLTLSNCKEWPARGLESAIEVLSTELEPATVPATDPAQAVGVVEAFEGAESDLVQEILKAAHDQGYLWCVVGQAKAKGSGTTVGYPDLSLRRPSWPRGLACLIEVKVAGGAVRPEQEQLHQDGWSYVVWSVEGAISALTQFENDVFAAMRAKALTQHNALPAAAGEGN